MGKVVVAGGSGCIGHAVVEAFHEAGHEVVVLSRSSRSVEHAKTVVWDGKGPGGWYDEVNGADVVVNLCGETLMQEWTPKSKARIRESRLGTTSIIGTAIGAGDKPAKVWLNASAVGWYGDTGIREVSEASPSAPDFLGTLCRDWEAEVDAVATPQTRKVKLRTGMVLGPECDYFKKLASLTKMFMGGPLGTGQNYVPWIHVRDAARMMVWASENDIAGPLNVTSPKPATNAEIMAAFRRIYGRPPVPGLPMGLVRKICESRGWEPDFLVRSNRVVPAIALARGFEFEFTDLDSALQDVAGNVPRPWMEESMVA